MIKNGFAEGGLLADASRTWRMESDYPEFEKGVANRLSKERVPEAEIEEQFNYSPLQRGYAEGGEIDFDTEGSMLDPEIPLNFEEDYSDRREASDFPAFEEEISAEGEEDILTGLSPEDQEILFQALSDYPELKEILNTISANDSSASFDTEVFDEEGSVEGPGTGTSDSIPANLSDGEFVFTAKAVSHLGVDKLRKMMAKAEADYDEGDAKQQFAQMGDEGFAAGGLLTRNDYKRGDLATRGTKIKPLPNTMGFALVKMLKRSGVEGIVKRKGNSYVIQIPTGFKYGGEVYEGSSYGENDEGTFTGESTPGTEKNIYYKERERKRLLGDLLYKILELDPVTFIKGRDGKPDVGRESSKFTET